MSDNNNQNNDEVVRQEGRGVLDVICEIKSGGLDPKRLSPEDRQACVMHLGMEGLSVPEIAQVLKVSDRTIMRDRKAIQEANALEYDPKLTGQIAWRVIAVAEACVNRIRRATRDKAASPGDRIDGERACFEIWDKCTHRLQSMGFVDTAAQQIQADLTHHLGEPMDIAMMRDEIDRLQQIKHDMIDTEATPVEPATNSEPTPPEPGGQDQGEDNHDSTQ